MKTRETPRDQVRYLSVEDGFNIKRPPIVPRVFLEEHRRAFAPETPTGLVPLDQGGLLELDFPATLPLILARYLRIRAGERVKTRLEASGEIYVVLMGTGATEWNEGVIAWSAGDVFVLPGGDERCHRAEGEDAVLYVATNEPLLAFERLRPPRGQRRPILPTQYTSASLEQEVRRLSLRTIGDAIAGRAVNLSSAAMEARRTCLPSLTVTLNLVLPGEAQRPHLHNAGALVLILKGSGCFSVIDGERFTWQDHTVLLTPPLAVHSHRNNGVEPALAVIVQDGGLYYHCRTMGFAFA